MSDSLIPAAPPPHAPPHAIPPVPHVVLACLQRGLAAGLSPTQAQAEALSRLLALRPTLSIAMARAQLAELLARLQSPSPSPPPPLALLRHLARPAWPEQPAG
jgi:hypothetical protein